MKTYLLLGGVVLLGAMTGVAIASFVAGHSATAMPPAADKA